MFNFYLVQRYSDIHANTDMQKERARAKERDLP